MKLKTKTIAHVKWLIIFALILIFGVFLLSTGMQIYYKSAYPVKYSEYVSKYADEFGLKESFVYAVIKTESGFNPNAVSYADAYGLMQIQEETFDWAKMKKSEKEKLTKDDLFDIETNIKYGCFIYSLLFNEFKTQNNAIIAYHAGWGITKKWLRDSEYSKDGNNIDSTPFADTNSYINKINETQKIYQKLYQFE